MAIGEFYDVTWGAVRLWCAEMQTSGGRTQVIHELADGDEHPDQDRGRVPGQPVTCSLLFVDMPREAKSAKDRFLECEQQVADGERLLFTHPIKGAYYVRVGAFDYTLDENGEISSCTIEFKRSAETTLPTPAGAGTSIAAGADRVAARSAELELLLADLDFGDDDPSDIPARAIAAQEAWADADIVSARQVIVDVAELSEDINSLIEDQGLEDDLALWPTFKATIFMGAAIREAALAALAETPKVTAIRIGTAISVLALAVRLYGGAEAESRVRQILALNDIRSPAWIPVGSVITVPIPRQTSRLKAA